MVYLEILDYGVIVSCSETANQRVYCFMKIGLRQFVLAKDQISVLVSKDFKLKYNSTALGFVWSLIVPVFTSIMYYFVFGVVMRWAVDNYLLYLLSGTFLWQFFSNVIMMNGGVLMANASLLKKTSFNRELLIWGTFFSESIHFLLTLIVLFITMAFYHIKPLWWSICPNLLILFLLLTLFSVGCSYIYSALNLCFRDLERIMNIFMTLWMFITPIFIPISAVPKQYLGYYSANPMTGIVGIARNLFYQPAFQPEAWIYPAVVSVLIFLFGRCFFCMMSPRFAEKM